MRVVVAATIQGKDEIVEYKTCHMTLMLFIILFKLILMCTLLGTLQELLNQSTFGFLCNF